MRVGNNEYMQQCWNRLCSPSQRPNRASRNSSATKSVRTTRGAPIPRLTNATIVVKSDMYRSNCRESLWKKIINSSTYTKVPPFYRIVRCRIIQRRTYLEIHSRTHLEGLGASQQVLHTVQHNRLERAIELANPLHFVKKEYS